MEDTRKTSFFSPWDLLPLFGAIGLGVVAATYWPRLPEAIPSHFGPNGRPDGWTPKAIAPWFLFGFPAFAWLMLALVAAVPNPKGPDHKAAMARAMAPLRGFLGLGICLISSLMVLIPIHGMGVFVPVLVAFFASLATGIALMARQAKISVPPEERDVYRWGLVYVNPDDPRVWVEKRIGIGWTLNFGRPMAWVWLVVLLAPVLVLMLVTVLK